MIVEICTSRQTGRRLIERREGVETVSRMQPHIDNSDILLEYHDGTEEVFGNGDGNTVINHVA